MSKTKINVFKQFISVVIKILNTDQNNQTIDKNLNYFYILFYFSQIFSYLYEVIDFTDEKILFLSKFIYYSNITNILLYINNKFLTFLLYFLIQSLISFFYIYILVVIYSKKSSVFLNSIYSFLFRFFFWILIVPSLDIIVLPLFCQNNKIYFNCDETYGLYFIFFSLYGLFLAIFLGFLYVWVSRDYSFLEINEIKLKVGTYSYISYFLRISLPILTPYLINRYDYLYYLLLMIIGIVLLFDYFYNFPIRPPQYNKLYISCLFTFIGSFVLETIFKYTDIFVEDDIFTMFLILGVIFYKYGNIYFNKIYQSIISSNFSNSNKCFFVYSFEELFLLFNDKKGRNKGKFIFYGMIFHHLKFCKDLRCKLNKGKFKQFTKLEDRDKIDYIYGFIQQKLYQEIQIDKKKNRFKEEMIYKYVTFLIKYNSNFANTYYKLQNINYIFNNKPTYSKILFKIYIKKMHAKIQSIQNEQNIHHTSDQKIVNTSTFLKITGYKENFENNLKKLLKSRINFWEKYKQGFLSYEEIAFNLYSEVSKNFKYKKILEQKFKSDTYEENLVSLKFNSIFNCVILNHVHQALKIEEQLDKIKQKSSKFSNFSPLSILEENLIVCEASFLKSEGVLLDSSKNERVASFFGENLQDIKMVKSIKDFMPNYIAESHQKIVVHSFSKKKKSCLVGKSIVTYAKNKKNFIFPIKIYFGYSLQYYNDFVIHAAISKQSSDDCEGLLFEKKGGIFGSTEPFFKFFQENFPKLRIEDFIHLNIYSLIPKIRNFIDINKIFNQDNNNLILRSLNGELLLPDNLEEIIEIIKFKKNELLDDKNQSKNSFGESFTTFQSIKTDSKQRVHKFVSKYMKSHENVSLSIKKETLIRFFTEVDEGYHEKIINDLINYKNSKKCSICFDLTFNSHRYGKEIDDVLIICWFKINEIGKIELDQASMSNLDENLPSAEISFLEKRLPTDNNIKILTELPQKTSQILLKQLKNDNENNLFVSDDTHQAMQKLNLMKNSMDNISMKSDNNRITDNNKPISNVELNDVLNTTKSKYMIKLPEKTEDKIEEDSVKKQSTGHHENRLNVKHLDDNNSQTSSTNTLKKSFLIFETIKLIQNHFPRSLIILTILLFFEIFLLLLFSIIIYYQSNYYITQIYQPLEITSMHQCRTNIGIDLSSLIFGEFEYPLYGLSNLSDFQKNELNRILKRLFLNARQMFYQDRNRQYSFSFGNYLQNLYLPYIDYKNTTKVQKLLLPDFTDVILEMLNSFVYDPAFRKSKVFMKNLIRNFPYYAIATRSLRETIQNTFIQTNSNVTSTILMEMIVMLSILGFIKIFEFFIFNAYYSKVRKLISIFVRVSIKDVNNELLFLKDVDNIFMDSKKSYFDINYAELRTNNKYILNDENEKISKLSKNEKAKKKQKNYYGFNFKNSSKLKMLIFLSFTFALEFGYFYGTYYFWTVTNQNIINLIQINTMFNDLYTFTTTDLNNQCFIVREKIFPDPEYQASKETYQQHSTRLTYFDVRYKDRLNLLKKYIGSLPNWAISAQEVINSDLYNEIMQGNLCDSLMQGNIIEQGQYAFCSEMFNQALTKGIFTAMNELTLYLTNQQGISAIINETNKTAVNKQVSDIYASLKNDLHTNVIITDYYLSETLYMFYEFLSGYYTGVLYKQINNLNNFMWIFCVLDIFVMILISLIIWMFLSNIYKYVAWSMAIIPYGKISSDEQTVFLIKNFWKQRNKI